jgi:hypothetical protein
MHVWATDHVWLVLVALVIAAAVATVARYAERKRAGR